MLNSQGLGEMVSRKKDAYQSNPQALQQRYQQSQELVDLLALQQLKSEKEAAARNMQMQMQQNPATIAQQREQEVLGMIKQEQGRKLGDVAQRTAGTLGQINKKAQQNVQRTAKQGLPAMGGPRKPAMMAGGGIVAFFEGSEEPVSAVSEEEISEYLSQFKQLDTPRNREMAKKDILTRKAQEARSAARTQALAGKTPGAGSRRAQRQFVKEYDPTAALGGPPKTEPSAASTKRTIPDMGGMGVLAPQLPKVEPDATKPQGLEALPESLTAKARTADYAGTTAQREAVQGNFKMLGLDPTKTEESVRKQRLEAVPEELGLEALSKTKESQLERMRALQAQQTDPDKLRRERLTAGLLGAAGRGSTALAGFGAGVFNRRTQQEAAAIKNLTDQFGIENEKLKLELDVAIKGIDSADKAVSALQQEKIGMAKVLEDATRGDFEAADREATRLQDTDEANISTTVALLKQRNDTNIASAGRAADRVEAIEKALAESVTARLTLSTPVTAELSMQLADGDIDEQEYTQQLKIHQMAVLNLLDEGGVLDQEEDMLRELQSLGVDVSSKQASLEERRRLLEASRSKFLPKQS